MKPAQPLHIKNIGAYHALMQLQKPEHPLVSVINFEAIQRLPNNQPLHLVLPFYVIALKRNFNARMKYGQQDYDFDEGLMTFMAPGQVLRIEVRGNEAINHAGLMLLVHPDFLWGHALAKTIKHFAYFDYAVNEALFLSEKEEATIISILQSIQQEYHANIDRFSQELIVTQLELLLKYAERFYQRQFLTRKITNYQILQQLEAVLDGYFGNGAANAGIPTVQAVADTLHVSPNYLSSLLKVLTGQSTQQHIHDKLIAMAKEKLSTSNLTVSEIAYELGFEHPQSFSKLFKTKTSQSPLAFRHSFH